MTKIIPKMFPLSQSKDISKMLKVMRKLVSDNSDIIQSIETGHLFYINDINHNEFVFYIEKSIFNENNFLTEFKVFYCPYSEHANQYLETWANLENIEELVKQWIRLIEEFNDTTFEEIEEMELFYEAEIFSGFEIIDEDADFNPFDNDRQMLLYSFLNNSIAYLEHQSKEGEKVDDIIEDVVQLRDDLANVSKKVFARRLSKVFCED